MVSKGQEMSLEFKKPMSYQYRCLGECGSRLLAPVPVIACFHCGGRLMPIPLENKSGGKPPVGGS